MYNYSLQPSNSSATNDDTEIKVQSVDEVENEE